MQLSLILPIYNQYTNLSSNFEVIYRTLKKDYGPGGFEIILVNDGSTDGSARIIDRLSRRRGVVVISRFPNRGRGNAVKTAVPVARGKVIGYIDTDLAVPIHYVKEAVGKVLEGHDVVIGSKYASGASYSRTAKRLLISRTSNFLVRAILGSRVTDHQCGFKFCSSRYLKGAVRRIRDDKWFFDTELLVRAQRDGIVPYEIPVKWTENRKSTFRVRDAFCYFSDILVMRFGLM